MIITRHIEQVRFDDEVMVMKIDGKELRFPLHQVSVKLLKADEVQRNLFRISPSGYGIHWPLIDEDLSVDFLLKNVDQ